MGPDLEHAQLLVTHQGWVATAIVNSRVSTLHALPLMALLPWGRMLAGSGPGALCIARFGKLCHLHEARACTSRLRFCQQLASYHWRQVWRRCALAQPGNLGIVRITILHDPWKDTKDFTECSQTPRHDLPGKQTWDCMCTAQLAHVPESQPVEGPCPLLRAVRF